MSGLRCEGESRQTGSWAPVDPKQAWEGSIFDEQRDPDKKWPNKKELQQKILVSHLSYQEQIIHEGSYINTSNKENPAMAGKKCLVITK